MKFLMVGLFALISLNVAIAQRGTKPNVEERAERQTEQMVKELSLNPNQQTQVASINLEYAKKMEAARADGSLAKGSTAMKDMRAEHISALKQVLTPEQAAQLDAMPKKGKKGKRKAKAEGTSSGKNIAPADRAARQTERMTEALSLTTAQQSQVAAINLDFAEQMAAVKNNSTDRTEVQNQMKAIKAAHRTQLEQVLSPEQVTLLDNTLRKGKRGKKDRRS